MHSRRRRISESPPPPSSRSLALPHSSLSRLQHLATYKIISASCHTFAMSGDPPKNGSSTASLSSETSRSPILRTPSLRLGHGTSTSNASHRQSFSDQLRGLPPSPRASRNLSFSQAQMQELLNNPPTAGTADPAFAGRDWRTITVDELVNQDDLRFVELDTGVEAATNVGY